MQMEREYLMKGRDLAAEVVPATIGTREWLDQRRVEAPSLHMSSPENVHFQERFNSKEIGLGRLCETGRQIFLMKIINPWNSLCATVFSLLLVRVKLRADIFPEMIFLF